MLKQLVDNERTDKNTLHSYLDLYETLFANKQETTKHILEIGIANGGSIKLWKDYFTNATIHGIDIINNNKKWDDIISDENIKLYTGVDAYNKDFFTNHFLNTNMKFDIIIDDGPHDLISMIHCITYYSQLLAPDGILIIEDVRNMKWTEILSGCVPEHMKDKIHIYDLRENKNRFDDIIFSLHN
jgi:hypothetical protein